MVRPSGGIAVPGDARGVLAVGAVDADGKVRPTSASGSGSGSELFGKPDLQAPDAFPGIASGEALGTDGAASFAAGWAAALLSAGVPAASIPSGLSIPPGGTIRVPDGVPRR